MKVQLLRYALGGARRQTALLLLTLLLCSCERASTSKVRARSSQPQTGSLAPQRSAPISDLLPTYPRARWRLAGSAMDNVVLFVSHIVIRYQGADVRAGLQRYPAWQPLAPVARSRADARSLALNLERTLKEQPTRFAELARRYSDDVVTRELGGTVGAAWPVELSAAYLDALACLAEGEISRAFETADGFHLLRRDPVPVDQKVLGERITIAYRTASPRHLVSSQRSRQQALDMAGKLLAELRREPTRFSALATQLSEARGTDVSDRTGVWSTREPGFSALEAVALARVPVGELAGPIDTPAGLQILRRLPIESEPRYAMHALHVRTPNSLPEVEREAAQQLLDSVQAQLSQSPASFDELRLRHCCTPIETFGASRFAPAVERALSALKVGELSVQPVYTELEVLFLKRLDPAAASPPEASVFELPSGGPQVDELLVHADGKAVARSLRDFTSAARKVLHLEGERDETFTRLLARMAQVVETASTERRKAELVRLKRELTKLLGPEGFARYAAYASKWATDELLQNRHETDAKSGS